MSAWEVITGDSLRVLADFEPESVDAIVSDPPYGLEFMGREWDRFREDDPATSRNRGERAGNHGEVRAEAREAAGGVRVEYGGGKRPTTSRCTGCGKRDQFRKPHDCAPGARWSLELIDPHAAPPSALAFQSWCREWARLAYRVLRPGGWLLAFGGTRTYHRMAAGVEDAGFEVRDQLQWLYGQGFPKSLNLVGEHEGKGTALKPAHEPIALARKPLTLPVAVNVALYGTGALNVDSCRVVGDMSSAKYGGRQITRPGNGETMGDGWREDFRTEAHPLGRWPSNVLVDPDAAGLVDVASGDLGVSTGGSVGKADGPHDAVYSGGWREARPGDPGFGDAGGASRFYYCAKASQAERNALELSYLPRARSARKRRHQDLAGSWRERARNRHPTVKPVDVMRWLVRLVTPVGGLVVDPFAGSGTTGCAAMLEGRRFVGIERDVGSAIVARARIAWWARHPDGMELVRRRELEAAREAVAAAGQLDLFELAASAPALANGRDGEASAERRYRDRGGSDFAMKPGRRRAD